MIRRVYHRIKNGLQLIARAYTKLYIKYSSVKTNKVVFDNFFGKGYGDNPKYIAEEIHRRGLKWDLVWLCNSEAIEIPPYLRKVRYGSLKARRELSNAKFVVDNVRNSMRVPKKDGQIYIQTWHGSLGWKKVESAAENKLNPNYVNAAKKDGFECDAILSSSALQTQEFKDFFWLNDKTQILEFGMPRTDVLFNSNVSFAYEIIREKLNISKDYRMLLCAQTFRDDQSTDGYILDFNKIVDAFERKTGFRYVILVRFHPNVDIRKIPISFDERTINASEYPDINDLYMVSDALITDYSSVAFDFSLLSKPVFLCMKDFEKFKETRGFVDTSELYPFLVSYNIEELVSIIEKTDIKDYMNRISLFRKEIWKPFDDGHCSENVVGWMRSQI